MAIDAIDVESSASSSAADRAEEAQRLVDDAALRTILANNSRSYVFMEAGDERPQKPVRLTTGEKILRIDALDEHGQPWAAAHQNDHGQWQYCGDPDMIAKLRSFLE